MKPPVREELGCKFFLRSTRRVGISAVGWANVEHYADNIKFRYHDKEAQKAWDHSGVYANVKYFHLTKKMYDNREMLGQYGDFSGHWTAEQLDLIHKQSLLEK